MVKAMELVAAALAVMWLIGVGPLHVKSELIHMLLALAAAAVLYRLVMGRRSTA